MILPVLVTPRITCNDDWTVGPDIVEDGRTYNYSILFNFLTRALERRHPRLESARRGDARSGRRRCNTTAARRMSTRSPCTSALRPRPSLGGSEHPLATPVLSQHRLSTAGAPSIADTTDAEGIG
jgi:hypothetical protein